MLNFSEEEMKILEKVSKMIMEEEFDQEDRFSVLKSRNEYFRSTLIKLQLLLKRRTCFQETPLHVAVKNAKKHATSAVK